MLVTNKTCLAGGLAILLSIPALMPRSPQQRNCAGPTSDCGVCDSTPPTALTGTGGDHNQYSFTHTADVNAVGTGAMLLYRYQHSIRNLESTVLFAEWADGDVSFQQIAPNRCGFGDSESGIKPKEKPDSMIVYGLTKELTNRASAYAPESPSRQIPVTKTEAPPLTSHSTATVMWHEKPWPIDLLMVTEVSDDLSFQYLVSNRGPQPVYLTLPGLTSRWASYAKIDDALATYQWQRAGKDKDQFRVLPEKTLKLVITPNLSTASASTFEFRSFTEERTKISVGLAPDDGVASMTISLYLPAKRPT